MTRELIIDGQHVDLSANTDITLEYVSNIAGDVGKISLSHSYTVKLPKTLRNARILDDPGNPAHESGQTRRFLSARFYRNGIDLLGDARAYVLQTTPESYEVALVWNTLEALQTLSQSKATLNDLPYLPTLTWIGSNGKTPDYTGAESYGALFAQYTSGLGGVRYPTINTAPHPSMRVSSLMDSILTAAGVPYTMTTAAQEAVRDLVVLAAPKHQPSRSMEIESGSWARSVILHSATINGRPDTALTISSWLHGWDAPSSAIGSSQTFTTGDNETHRVLFNLRAPSSADLSGVYLRVMGAIVEDYVIQEQEELLRAYFKRDASGWYLYIDEEVKLSGWPSYVVTFGGVQTPPSSAIAMTAYDALLPMLAVNRVHNDINIAKDNRFPLAGNLPDLKQWDFMKACMVMLGIAPVIESGRLRLLTYDELLSTDDAYDWSRKVDMTDGGLQGVNVTLDQWAQSNLITFEKDTPLSFEPDARLMIEDATLPESRDLYKLPFGASMQGEAVHYKVTSDNEVENVDISPRIFRLTEGESGRVLEFNEDMYGEGLVAARYAKLQEVVRKPVRISVNVRLHELDLAQLDLTRPVYLSQYGHYYSILKIQTSDTDLCKLELLQIA